MSNKNQDIQDKVIYLRNLIQINSLINDGFCDLTYDGMTEEKRKEISRLVDSLFHITPLMEEIIDEIHYAI